MQFILPHLSIIRNPDFRKANGLYKFDIRDPGIADLGCMGTEDDISKCIPVSMWGTNTCDYKEFVGISCGNAILSF